MNKYKVGDRFLITSRYTEWYRINVKTWSLLKEGAVVEITFVHKDGTVAVTEFEGCVGCYSIDPEMLYPLPTYPA